jgi:CelD/BcsL family acetyltransferase involved in cellulose biosynthesis
LIEAERVPAADLAKDPALLACWRALQDTRAVTRNPFYAPEFAIAVGRIRSDAHVAVLRDGKGRIAGFLPFQGDRRAWPIGYPFSDHHGILLEPGIEVDAPRLLRACGLESFEFRNVPAEQEPFQPGFRRVRTSHVIDLDRFALRNAEGRKRRKIERELGPLRFVPHVTDRRVLEQLFEWKSAWCRSAGVEDVFREPWIRALVSSLLDCEGEDCRGVLSALYAGERVVAIHMGPRSSHVWHWWFPTYDADLAPFSPGLLMLLHMIESAQTSGLSQIDFGTGPEAFKRRFANAGIAVASGAVERSGIRRIGRGIKWLARDALAGSPLEAALRRGKTALRGR